MRPHLNRRHLVGTAAVLATAAAGLSPLAATASAATQPTATVTSGVLTVTGTASRDVIDLTEGANQITIDFGSNGTVDARFPMSGIHSVNVLGGDGNDGISAGGAG